MYHVFDFNRKVKFNIKITLNLLLVEVVILKLVAPDMANRRFFYVKNVLKLELT